MEILEAYDLTGSLRAAAALCGCDHKTVGLWVRAREQAGWGAAGATCPFTAGDGAVPGEGGGAGGSLARQDPCR